MKKDSIFGIERDQLKDLLSLGHEKPDPASSTDTLLEQPGSWVGSYKLLEVLGEGGMGVVYLAEQTRPIRRRVALKVIKPGMDSKKVVSRFEAERQVLALLAHANIAQVLDAGTTELGRPYFVMEYVKGPPITHYCDRHTLPIEARLRLFAQVCHAVHHAHRRGIIHRDIKPSNILVSEQDDRSVPKIIDFGVAKAMALPLTERTLFTEQGKLFGTPEYMSPEQADQSHADVDTRSDVYALGVLLYELLVGALPFSSEDLRKHGLRHISRMIRETDPQTPSTRLTKLGDQALDISRNRQTELTALVRHLHRELEWIPLKAMHKERKERYQSAAELADDVENYLQGAALMAGPPSALYRLKKLIRRHAGWVAAVVTVLVVLTAGIVASTLFALRAEQNRAEAQAIADFLIGDVFQGVSYADAQRSDLSYIFDVATESLKDKFEDQPLVEARIRGTLGWTYREFDKPEQALQQLERADQIYLEEFGPEDEATIGTRNLMGWVYRDLDRIGDAERIWTEQLQIAQRVHGPGHDLATDNMNSLGCIYSLRGEYDKAENIFRKAHDFNARVHGDRHFHLFVSLNLGGVLRNLGRYKKAEQLQLEALNIARQTWTPEERRHPWGPEDPWTLGYTNGLAETYRKQGRYSEAEELYANTLESLRRLYGHDHSSALATMLRLGILRMDQGKLEEAEQLLADVSKGQQHQYSYGEMSLPPSTLGALAVLRTKQERYAEARELFEKVLDTRQGKLDDDHPAILTTRHEFGVLCREQGSYEEAETFLTQAMEGRSVKLGPDHPDTLKSRHELALLYMKQTQYDRAEPLLLQALEDMRIKLGDRHPRTLQAWHNLIDLYDNSQEPEQANQWRAILPVTM
jgi:eukaryotic-like serine/threonine-protein kinase